MEPTKPPMEENQPPNPTNRSEPDDTPNRQDWWDDVNLSRLIDLEAFRRFLYGCNQLLENSDSDRDDDEVASPTVGSSTGPSSDEQPKLRQSPSTKGCDLSPTENGNGVVRLITRALTSPCKTPNLNHMPIPDDQWLWKGGGYHLSFIKNRTPGRQQIRTVQGKDSCNH